MLVDAAGEIVGHGSAPLGQAHPQPGWVEQSAEEIWDTVRAAVGQCLSGHDPARVAGLGLSTQRESLVLWERESGPPGRAHAVLAGPADGASECERSRAGALCLGTVDSWLLSRFGGEHVVEVGNAARTQLRDVRARAWDPRLLELFNVPAAVLPRVVASTGPFPAARGLAPLPVGVPVGGVMGDSHSALFAHAGWRPGQVKATYGTGSSIVSLGDPAAQTTDELCLTIAWDAGTPRYAFEGNIRSSGATLTWLAESSAPHRPTWSPPRAPAATACTSCPPSAASARRGGTTPPSARSAA